MPKHSVVIRIGASYDDVTVNPSNGASLYFDRAALNQQRTGGSREAKDALYGLRKGVIDAFVVMQAEKSRRRTRRARKGYANA